MSRIIAPELAAAKQQVHAAPTLLANFQEVANFITLSVTPLKIMNREIGAVDAKNGTANQAADLQSTMSPMTLTTGYARGRARGHTRGLNCDSFTHGCGRGRGRGSVNFPRLPTTNCTPA